MKENEKRVWELLFDEGEGLCFGMTLESTKVRKLSEVIPSDYQFTCLNPLKDRRCDANVTAHRNILMEIDDMPLRQQLEHVERIGMPWTTCTYSGGKSYHYVIALAEPVTRAEYDGYVDALYRAVEHADTSCRNPSRFTRTPFAKRSGTWMAQSLVGTRERVTREALDSWLASRNVEAKPVERPEVVEVEEGELAEKAEWLEKFLLRNDVAHWAAEANIGAGGGYRYSLLQCPFCGDKPGHHDDRKTAVFLLASGAYGFHCFHASCDLKGWAEFRAEVEGSGGKVIVGPKPDSYSGVAASDNGTDLISGEKWERHDGKPWINLLDPKLQEQAKFDWVVEDFLPAGQTMLFAGESKAGKSVIMLWLLRCLTYSEPFLGGKPNGPKHVLYLDWENPVNYVANWAVKFAAGLDPKPWGDYVHYRTHYPLPLCEETVPTYLQPEYLACVVKPFEPGVIVVDTVRGAFGSTPKLQPNWECQPSEVGKLLRPFTTWAHGSGWSVVFLHHLNQGGKVSGATDFLASCDVACRFWRNRDEGKHRCSFSLMGRLSSPIEKRAMQFHGDKFEFLGLDLTEARKAKELSDQECEKLLAEKILSMGEGAYRTTLRKSLSWDPNKFDRIVARMNLKEVSDQKGTRLCL